MPSTADRNLLFGILALQMEFITQAGLIAALQAWTLQKSRPLGELLVELGHMAADDRAALEPMVDRHVARHGGSAEQSLAALSSVPDIATEVRSLLERVARGLRERRRAGLFRCGSFSSALAINRSTQKYFRDCSEIARTYCVSEESSQAGKLLLPATENCGWLGAPDREVASPSPRENFASNSTAAGFDPRAIPA